MSFTIQTDFEGVKKLASEFLKALPTLNLDELENGWKCFVLAYLGCEYPDDFIGQTNRHGCAPALYRIVSREHLNRWMRLRVEEDTKAAQPMANYLHAFEGL